MRVLLDENVDRLLKSLFATDFKVFTVHERGWNGKNNGELLRLAEREFDAFVTIHRKFWKFLDKFARFLLRGPTTPVGWTGFSYPRRLKT